MASVAEWPASRIGALIGHPVVGLRPIGAAGFGRPYVAELADGDVLFVKAQRDAPPGFFADEAEGLRWLGSVSGGASTATVRAVDDEMLILDWIGAEPPTASAANEFGRRLAVTHDAGAEHFGRDRDTFLASEPLPAGDGYADWAAFYAGARLQPFLDRAVVSGAISDHDRKAVAELISRVSELIGPEEPPSRLHGDLWSGNLLWTAKEVLLIDPATYGGHRELDLAMLQLFGAPELAAILVGYQDQHPLAAGWRDRISLYQLFPLLVHTVIFGGSYGAAAGGAARRALRAARS